MEAGSGACQARLYRNLRTSSGMVWWKAVSKQATCGASKRPRHSSTRAGCRACAAGKMVMRAAAHFRRIQRPGASTIRAMHKSMADCSGISPQVFNNASKASAGRAENPGRYAIAPVTTRTVCVEQLALRLDEPLLRVRITRLIATISSRESRHVFAVLVDVLRVRIELGRHALLDVPACACNCGTRWPHPFQVKAVEVLSTTMSNGVVVVLLPCSRDVQIVVVGAGDK